MSTKSLKVLLLLSCAVLIFLLNGVIHQRQEKLVYLKKRRDNIQSFIHVFKQQKDMPFTEQKRAVVVADCFEKMQELAQKHNVRIVERQMGESEASKDIFMRTQNIIFRMQSTGLVSIHQFLHALENQKNFYQVDKFDIGSLEATPKNAIPQYNVEMHLTVYLIHKKKR